MTGMGIMLADLLTIHNTLFEAYKAVMLLTGVDLEAFAALANNNEASLPSQGKAPRQCLPIK